MAARMAMPGFSAPMKALGVTRVPEGVWHCEIKFDGFRGLALVREGKAELWSRNRKPLSADYPSICTALNKLKCEEAVIDGEIVAVDKNGRSRFQLLQGHLTPDFTSRLVYYGFDLLSLDGEDLMDRPWEERRARLEKLMRKMRGSVQLSPVFDVEPAELLKVARAKGLEGIIAKRPGSLYETGRRSGAWQKCKVLAEQEFVIGGFTAPKESRIAFGAILVGYYQEGKLLYAGKVGTGFDHETLRTLHADFEKHRRPTCPFANLPMTRRSRFGTGMTAAEMKKVSWLKPQCVAQVRFAEWTQDGLLRQPVFLGLRTDKSPRSVRREAGAVV